VTIGLDETEEQPAAQSKTGSHDTKDRRENFTGVYAVSFQNPMLPQTRERHEVLFTRDLRPRC